MRLICGRDVLGQSLACLGAHAIWRTGTIGLLLVSACATHQAPTAQTQPVVDMNAGGESSSTNGRTRVRVENQNLADMTIYVYRGSQRMRLGRATGNGVTNLDIPKSMVSGLTELRFQAEPIGNQRGIISQPIPVNPGDLVDFTIPPR
jgi:hypothetical protein